MFKKLFSRMPLPIDVASLGPDYHALRAHIAQRIAEAQVGQAPYHHLFVDRLFPEPFYELLHNRLRAAKTSDKVRARKQDSSKFVNRRYPLAGSPDLVIRQFQAVFQDREIKSAFLSKFYADTTDLLIDSVDIHLREFEFILSEPGRFQTIHVDIPPKYMSFVFYLPDVHVDAAAEEKNATVLYDRNLEPVYGARFRRNSVCVFAPHFYSYHGFSTTIERDVLVMFYINSDDMRAWERMRKARKDDGPDFTDMLDLIEDKLRRHPLIEYGSNADRVAVERKTCRINAPQGRVHVD